MKKYLFAVVLLSLVFANSSFAQAGKVTPFKWYKGADIIDLVDACPVEDIDPTELKPTISNMTGSLRVMRTDGSEGFYDNRNGQNKSPIGLKDGDQIETRGGSASINFSDGSSWVLDGNTTIKYSDSENLVKVKLMLGKLRILLPTNFLAKSKSKVQARLETKMKTAAACVRGTDFVMEQTEDENTSKYYLHEGTLDIATLQGDIKHLQSGDIATVDVDSQVVLTKLDDSSWNEVVKNLAPVGGINPPAQEEETSGWLNNYGWYLLLIIICGGFYVYRKKSR